MLRLSHITATGLLLIGLSANVSAEVINLPTAEVETTEAETTGVEVTEIEPMATETTEFSVQLPGRGMSMENVQNRFGEAQEKFSAVGEPPITKWVYKNFTVYFESEFVIHAVVNN
ncbi:MAG: hypothetical protein BMS9Abin31_1214 [Gammaproteobacteria bacterium]|nr:MAG: hypothetical protein BMS9Abin31_1214 [Gammaproteobacteria bacterium]